MKNFLFLCTAILIPSLPAWPACQDRKLGLPDEFSTFSALAWSPDGKVIAGAKTTEGEIILWDAATGKVRATLKGKGDPHLDWIAFSGGGKALVGVTSGEGTAFVWNLSSGRLFRSFPLGGKIFVHAGHARISIGGRGRYLATVSERIEPIQGRNVKQSGTLAVWDLKTGRPKWKKDKLNVVTLALAPNGRTLAIASATPTKFKFAATISRWEYKSPNLRILSVSTGKENRSAALKGAVPQRLVISPYGKTISGLGLKKLTLWDAKTLEPTSECDLPERRSVFRSFAFSKDGKSVARAAREWIDVVKIEGGKLLVHRTTPFTDLWSAVAYSPDLTRIACLQDGPRVIDLIRKE